MEKPQPRPKRKPRFKLETVEAALRESGGIRSLAAAKLHCSPSTITNYLDRHPKLALVIEEVENGMLDLAEAGLLKLIQQNDRSAIFYYLNNKGRGRGYGNRIRVDATVDATITSDDPNDLTDEELLAIARTGLRTSSAAPEGKG